MESPTDAPQGTPSRIKKWSERGHLSIKIRRTAFMHLHLLFLTQDGASIHLVKYRSSVILRELGPFSPNCAA